MDNSSRSTDGPNSSPAESSVHSSSLDYRIHNGRTYHRPFGKAESWEPNDEQHLKTMRVNHEMCRLILSGKLFLAPLRHEKLEEPSLKWYSVNQGGIPNPSALSRISHIFWSAGQVSRCSFRVVEDDLQRKGMEEAGFVDITVKEYKVPVGDWPEDEVLKTVGHAAMKAYTTDIEGYLNHICNAVLGWAKMHTVLYGCQIRKQLAQPDLRAYVVHRIVYSKKPE